MQTEEKFIKTENAGRIMDASSQAVEKNGWLVVMGQPGTGKSTIYQELIRFWKSYPNKFILIETKSFKLVQTRTNILMKRIIKAINPDEHAPGDIETRYEKFSGIVLSMRIVEKRK
ncbi:MAG: hypothetical protein HS129_15225 [Leptospiraceae bacterium]|nr:hypothetical protein [Leptospiraceae bacterium]